MKRVYPDVTRFRQIVRGKIRDNLKRYITRGEVLGKQGKNFVSIPIPQIDIPKFKYGKPDSGGVGQGPGDLGSPVGGDPKPGDGQAGEEAGEHALEVDVSLEELAQILGEELELPNIEPRGKKQLETHSSSYTGVNRRGPESLRHFKRTFKQSLKRQIMAGMYDPERPVIIPIHDDKRFRAAKTKAVPESNAVIIYMMDVSGSMGNEQKEIVRIESFWIDTWLRSQYRDLETRYVVHDAVAREVDHHTFFHLRESGGTKISSAYALCAEMVEKDYDPQSWNIYPIHFSDGDNWGGDDTTYCMSLLKQKILTWSNVFCYGQVKSAYGSGQFIKDLKKEFEGEERILLSEINSRDDIYPSIKTFLGKGK